MPKSLVWLHGGGCKMDADGGEIERLVEAAVGFQGVMGLRVCPMAPELGRREIAFGRAEDCFGADSLSFCWATLGFCDGAIVN